MRYVRGLIDRLLLLAATIMGGLVPGFISQYRQRLGGRLDQALADLAPWQHLADQYHHGHLAELIQYHLASPDPTFRAEGAIIQSLVQTVARLQVAFDALHTTLFRQVAYLSTRTDPVQKVEMDARRAPGEKITRVEISSPLPKPGDDSE